MFTKKYLTISDFAKISGVSRQALIYYDRIGLFSPAVIADNRYRMYLHNQVDNIGIIMILSDLGVPLKKIKEILADISVDTMEKTLHYQLAEIEKKIEKLSMLKHMTQIRLDQIAAGKNFLNGTSQQFHLTEIRENIPICVSDGVNCDQEKIEDETIIRFFNSIEKSGLPMIFSLGYIKNSTDILRGDENIVSCFWFRLNEERYANAVIPVGRYLVGYAKGDYGDTNYIYQELLAFARDNGLKITGDFYEEYLIDELSEKNPDDFVMQVFVKIEELSA